MGDRNENEAKADRKDAKGEPRADGNENEAKADNAEDQKSVKKEETTPAPAPATQAKEKGNRHNFTLMEM